MTVNPYWPLVSWQTAFNAGANDPGTTPSWTELISRLWSWDSSFGRQYEADVNQAGEAEATLDDPDEALNPANASSPYAPGVLPYRQFIHQVMWPPAPVGGAVNMLNATSGFDQTFDSYSVGSTPSWLLTVGGTTPTVTASTPLQGSHDVVYNVLNNSTEQGIGWAVACIPGQQYTASLYVKQTAANTTQIFINAGPAGTSTTATGTYVRLTVTWTATQPIHQIWVASFVTGLASIVQVDAIQMEPGATASTFSSAIGPVIYGVARGLVERWPSGWDYNGIRGRCDIVCVDALAALAQIPMHTDYVNTLLGLDPDYYWWLQDQQGSTTFADVSGNAGPPLVNYESKYGDGTLPNAGQSMAIVGDPSGPGVQFTPDPAGPSGLHQAATIIGNGRGSGNVPGVLIPAAIGSSYSFTVSAWVTCTPTNPVNNMAIVLGFTLVNAPLFAFWNPFYLQVNTLGNAALAFSNWNGTASTFTSTFGTKPIADGNPHLLVATVTQVNGGNTVLNLYVDGVLDGTHTVTTASVGMLGGQANTLQVGGEIDLTTVGNILNGTVSHVAIWNSRALSAGEVTQLWNAGGLGFAGETSGARITRYLGYGYSGLTNIDTGASIMGAGKVAEGDAMLDSCQFVETSENGDFWADQYGTLQFRGRQYRYLNTTPDWVFGENAAGGEAPYEQGIVFDFDPTLIGNVITITQTNGIVVQVTDPTSIKAYFPHTFDREIGVQSPLEVYDAANWFKATRKDPKQRIEAIQLHPSANPALWPIALGVRKGDRITVNRRTTAGLNMQIDFFVEQVGHAHSPGDWLTTFQMSPIIGQPWILQDPTFGLLGSTTVLGY